MSTIARRSANVVRAADTGRDRPDLPKVEIRAERTDARPLLRTDGELVHVTRAAVGARKQERHALRSLPDLEQVGEHELLVPEGQVVGVGELLGAADLLPVLGEQRAEAEEGVVRDLRGKARLLE